jgi:hypothetical protein
MVAGHSDRGKQLREGMTWRARTCPTALILIQAPIASRFDWDPANLIWMDGKNS